jgi:hypothetical protein
VSIEDLIVEIFAESVSGLVPKGEFPRLGPLIKDCGSVSGVEELVLTSIRQRANDSREEC